MSVRKRTPALISMAAETHHHKLRGFNQHKLVSYSSAGSRSQTSLTGLQSRCRQGCTLWGGSREESILWPSPAWGWGHLHPLAHGPSLHLQSQQQQVKLVPAHRPQPTPVSLFSFSGSSSLRWILSCGQQTGNHLQVHSPPPRKVTNFQIPGIGMWPSLGEVSSSRPPQEPVLKHAVVLDILLVSNKSHERSGDFLAE